jgi:hypothetical protein
MILPETIPAMYTKLPTPISLVKVAAVSAYMKKAGQSLQAQNRAAEIHIMAQRKMGELLVEMPTRDGFMVTNLASSPAQVVNFYNQRGTAEQWIKEG